MNAPAGTLTTLEAIEELARRGSRVSTWVAIPFVTTGILVGLAGYVWLREFQLERFGIHFPWATAIASWALPIGVSIGLAKLVSRRLIRSQRSSWISEMALRHRLDKAELEESFGDWV